MRRRWILALAGALLTACGAFAVRRAPLASPRPVGPAASAAPSAPPARSLYVASFDEREAALAFALEHGVSELTLYGLGRALGAEPAALAAFVAEARARGLAVAAPIAGLDRVEALARYEAAHPEGRFDGWSTELEYWNAPPNERPHHFEQLQALLTAMRAAKRDGWIACYLGYPSAEEAAWIAAHVDRVYLSFAVPDPARALEWGEGLRSHRARHGYFDGRVPIWPIVYTRGDAHLRPWLAQRSIAALEEALARALGGRMAGVAYFDHGSLRDVFR
ncbi:MAG: hypothetical protein KF729_24685 [Sandaracinaceae bacterium]|nr:hypothetical protein [Sandaracinaceae bacterium]